MGAPQSAGVGLCGEFGWANGICVDLCVLWAPSETCRRDLCTTKSLVSWCLGGSKQKVKESDGSGLIENAEVGESLDEIRWRLRGFEIHDTGAPIGMLVGRFGKDRDRQLETAQERHPLWVEAAP